jgi:hypothetical protein
MFRDGLPHGLNKAIFEHVTPQPNTLGACISAARAHHQKWLEWDTHWGKRAKNLKERNKGNMRDRAQRYHNSGRCDENAMDVDGVAVNAMTAEEKANCMKRGACFFCKNTSHMVKACPKKQGRKKPWQTNQITTQTQANQVATNQTTAPMAPMPPPPQTDHDAIRGNMKSLPQEERRALLEQMLDDEGF